MSGIFGHVKKTPRVTRKAQAWYDELTAELLVRLDAAILAQEQRQAETAGVQTTPPPPEVAEGGQSWH